MGKQGDESVDEAAAGGAEVEEAILAPAGPGRPKEGRQSPQGRTLPPTFEKPREERAYEWEVSPGVQMCQLFCTRNAELWQAPPYVALLWAPAWGPPTTERRIGDG